MDAAEELPVPHSTEWHRQARSHFSLTGELPSEHGLTGYIIGCRCKVCCAANSDYGREWRARRKEAGRGRDQRSTYDGPEWIRCPDCRRLVKVRRTDGCISKHDPPGGLSRCKQSGRQLPVAASVDLSAEGASQ